MSYMFLKTCHIQNSSKSVKSGIMADWQLLLIIDNGEITLSTKRLKMHLMPLHSDLDG